MEDIKLKKIGHVDENQLPRNVHVIVFGNDVVFVKRYMGKFLQLPEEKQKELREKHVK